jgi:thiol:disulfide interchange protein DsbD
MSFLPQFANPYIDALVGGLLYGSVFCTSACLPFVAGYIAGVGAGFKKGLAITAIFNSGRIVAYALLGAAVGLFRLAVGGTFLTAFQQYASAAFGVVTVIIGSVILVKSRSSKPACDCKPPKRAPKFGRFSGRFDFGAFTLGLSRGLVVCTPLVALLVYAATFASPVDSVLLAVLFGVGTTISPIILLGGATGWLLNKAPLFRKWISILGAVVLILLGILSLITPLLVTSP